MNVLDDGLSIMRKMKTLYWFLLTGLSQRFGHILEQAHLHHVYHITEVVLDIKDTCFGI